MSVLEIPQSTDLIFQPAGPDAPCHFVDPELFFAELPADVELAKALCRGCALREACLAGALERGEPHGVWGGELFVQGAIVARKKPRGRPRKVPLPEAEIVVPVLPPPGRESPFRAA